MVTDWGGKVAAWFAGVSGVSAALAGVVWQSAKQPMNGPVSDLFVGLVAIGAASFLMLLLTGPSAVWSAWRSRRLLLATGQASSAGHPLSGSGAGQAAGSLASGQANMLRDARAAFDKFVPTDEPAVFIVNDDFNTRVLLKLPEVDEGLRRLDGISVADWPEVGWANGVAAAVSRTREMSRRFNRRSSSRERDELLDSVRELRERHIKRRPSQV